MLDGISEAGCGAHPLDNDVPSPPLGNCLRSGMVQTIGGHLWTKKEKLYGKEFNIGHFEINLNRLFI